MKRHLVLLAFFFTALSQAAFVELNDVREFEDLIKTSTVPVVVQFHASWCGPCKSLIKVFNRIAPSYQDSQVRLAYIDADEHTTLKSYLKGGYPTVRTFVNGTVTAKSFTGSQTESYLRNFIEGVKLQTAAEYRSGSYCPID